MGITCLFCNKAIENGDRYWVQRPVTDVDAEDHAHEDCIVRQNILKVEGKPSDFESLL